MRLFVAVELGDRIRDRVAAAIEQVRRCSPGSKWVRPEGAHLTLVFLGWVSDARVDAHRDVVRRSAARHGALTLKVAGSGSFGSPGRPRVLWLGVGGQTEALEALQRDLVAELMPLGLVPEERVFRPHLTLARARDKSGDRGLAEAAEVRRDADLGEARVEHLVLFRSELSACGARYSALERAALGMT